MKTPKKKSISKLKKELDAIFSIYIREKYNNEGTIKCYTCHKRLDFKSAQCGHFVSRQHLSTRYDEENCRPQCVGCNVFGGGKVAEFARNLEAEKKGIVVKLYKKSGQLTFWREADYEKKIKEFKEKIT